MLLFGVLLLGACERKDFDYVLPQPKVLFTDGRAARAGIPDGTVRANLTLQTAEEIQSLQIKQSINGAAATDLTPVTEFSNAVLNTFTYPYKVPATAKAGDVIKLTMEAVDKKGTRSAPVEFTVNVVGALFESKTISVNGQEVIEIAPPAGAATAIINQDEFTFEANKRYLLRAVTQVEEGLTVVMQAGTTLYASTDNPAVVVMFSVPAGAFIRANGTDSLPVVMTSDKVLKGTAPAPGDWRGLSITGRARTAATDNSGTLRYVRVEYGGREEPAPSVQSTGGILFTSVGSGTTVQYVQSYKSLGQGIRFNGGTVRCKYLIATDPGQEAFRFDDDNGSGFTGFGQFWIGNNTSVNRDAEEVGIRDGASPRLANVTVLGRGAIIRSTAGGYRIFNMMMAQIPDDGVRVELPGTGAGLNDDKVIGHSYLFDIRDQALRDNAPVFSQEVYKNVIGTRIAGIGVNDYTPDGAGQTSEYDPKALNSWFDAAKFIGAIRDSNADSDWTAGGWSRK
ncbi:MAG: hypothetical protein MUD08_06920 [Cytophagales bacterium]|nr:hypothetical protein [Cytophagales bacterium]